MAASLLSVLTPEQLKAVARKAKGSQRPRYYSPQLAKANAAASVSQQTASIDPEVQISEDLEAAIILMPAAVRTDLINVLRSMLGASTRGEDLALMREVAETRATSYVRVNTDVAGPLIAYEDVRGRIGDFLNRLVRQSPEPTTAAEAEAEAAGVDTQVTAGTDLAPEIAVLFASLADDYAAISAPDILSIHDRIADAGVLYAYDLAGIDQTRELTSWISILVAYT